MTKPKSDICQLADIHGTNSWCGLDAVARVTLLDGLRVSVCEGHLSRMQQRSGNVVSVTRFKRESTVPLAEVLND